MAKPKSWRDVVPVHPACDLLPRMNEAELVALGADIREHGQLELITFCDVPQGAPGGTTAVQLADGRNRLDAMEAAGITLVASNGDFLWAKVRWCKLPKDADPVAYIISKNIHRRHLSLEQRRELAGKLLRAAPEKSDRSVAEMVKVDHKTVGAERKRLPRRDPHRHQGPQQPISKPKPKAKAKDPVVVAAANRAQARSEQQKATAVVIAGPPPEQVAETVEPAASIVPSEPFIVEVVKPAESEAVERDEPRPIYREDLAAAIIDDLRTELRTTFSLLDNKRRVEVLAGLRGLVRELEALVCATPNHSRRTQPAHPTATVDDRSRNPGFPAAASDMTPRSLGQVRVCNEDRRTIRVGQGSGKESYHEDDGLYRRRGPPQQSTGRRLRRDLSAHARGLEEAGRL